MKIKLENTFHGTSVVVNTTPNNDGTITLTKSQKARAAKKLCGMSDCKCGTFRGGKYAVNPWYEGEI